MGRHYAGILAAIAFVTIVIRGLIEGTGVESTMHAAILTLICFSMVGYVIGRLAGWVVLDSVRAQLTAETAARPSKAM